eukprot:2186720-Alexandrium_andersonii.AAC.1
MEVGGGRPLNVVQVRPPRSDHEQRGPWCVGVADPVQACDAVPEQGSAPVSYTHLTLPTICSV